MEPFKDVVSFDRRQMSPIKVASAELGGVHFTPHYSILRLTTELVPECGVSSSHVIISLRSWTQPMTCNVSGQK